MSFKSKLTSTWSGSFQLIPSQHSESHRAIKGTLVYDVLEFEMINQNLSINCR